MLSVLVLVVTSWYWMASTRAAAATISGELRQWHRVTLTFDGPTVSEGGSPNPFLDYRLSVTFTNGGKQYTVPGFFAADGNAAETGATSGNKWRVHFTPDATGTWTYQVSFRTGSNVAVSDQAGAGTPGSLDGLSGSFQVSASNKTGADFRAKGMLRYVGKHHFQHASTGEYFLKGGAGSPENFLAYKDFDDTYDLDNTNAFIHEYQPHLGDWKSGDPTWKNGKGKGIIGALNYLASKGVNSQYFIVMTGPKGDGKDVWPWTDPNVVDRYDVSKLDQWEIVFSHMDKLGIHLHFFMQEAENDHHLDNGDLGTMRKLYYRELVARFAHHLGITWDMGEEPDNTTARLKSYAAYVRQVDPYDHPISQHTYPREQDKIYPDLLGDPNYESAALQVRASYNPTRQWREASAAAGRPWVVAHDEQVPGSTGVTPDADDPSRDVPRQDYLWGNLMAGGGGVEWYFGYGYAHNDVNAEDFRSRDKLFDQTRYALDFFRNHTPFWDMSPHDGLTSGGRAPRVLAKLGHTYVVYQTQADSAVSVNLANGTYTTRWYNPRTGQFAGNAQTVNGGGMTSMGTPPTENNKDWALLITTDEVAPPPSDPVQGDVNGDGVVTSTDLGIVLASYGRSGRNRSQGDVSGDGTVNGLDLSEVVSRYGN